MRKWVIFLCAATFPLLAQGELDPRDYNYPGFRKDWRVLKNNYRKLQYDRSHGMKSAVRDDEDNIDDVEDEINRRQDDHEYYIHDRFPTPWWAK